MIIGGAGKDGGEREDTGPEGDWGTGKDQVT